MSKSSDDLSALFRSLRPDESVFTEDTSSGMRDAEQRWPLFRAVAPQKPQDAPALSDQERQRWASQEKPVAGARKPALSLPGLSDKMSKGLGKISGQAVRNTATVKPAKRWEPEEHVVEGAMEQPWLQPSERTETVLAEPVPLANAPANRVPTATNALSEVPAAASRAGLGVFDKKPVPMVQAPVPVQMPEVSQHDLPVTGVGDKSLKSIFSRLEAKPEVEVKSVIKRSSFLDRLGKR